MERLLRLSDFKYPGDICYAKYIGNNKYLKQGEWYYVHLLTTCNQVGVSLGNNPQIKRSNGGVQFGLNTFVVENNDIVEDNDTMIKLEDLSSEDLSRLMEEARKKVEEENLAKDAAATYSIKKKELVDKTVEEIGAAIKLKPGPEIAKLRTHFISMSNYILMLCINRKGNSNTKICTAREWEIFENICKSIKESTIKGVNQNG